MSRAKYNSVTSKEDHQQNKLSKQCSKFPSKTMIASVSLMPTLNNVLATSLYIHIYILYIIYIYILYIIYIYIYILYIYIYILYIEGIYWGKITSFPPNCTEKVYFGVAEKSFKDSTTTPNLFRTKITQTKCNLEHRKRMSTI